MPGGKESCGREVEAEWCGVSWEVLCAGGKGFCEKKNKERGWSSWPLLGNRLNLGCTPEAPRRFDLRLATELCRGLATDLQLKGQ